jgi:hypothetical protein
MRFKKKKLTEQRMDNSSPGFEPVRSQRNFFISSKPSTCLLRESIKVNLESPRKTTPICEHPQKDNFIQSFPFKFLEVFLGLENNNTMLFSSQFQFY